MNSVDGSPGWVPGRINIFIFSTPTSLKALRTSGNEFTWNLLYSSTLARSPFNKIVCANERIIRETGPYVAAKQRYEQRNSGGRGKSSGLFVCFTVSFSFIVVNTQKKKFS